MCSLPSPETMGAVQHCQAVACPKSLSKKAPPLSPEKAPNFGPFLDATKLLSALDLVEVGALIRQRKTRST